MFSTGRAKKRGDKPHQQSCLNLALQQRKLITLISLAVLFLYVTGQVRIAKTEAAAIALWNFLHS